MNFILFPANIKIKIEYRLTNITSITFFRLIVIGADPTLLRNKNKNVH